MHIGALPLGDYPISKELIFILIGGTIIPAIKSIKKDWIFLLEEICNTCNSNPHAYWAFGFIKPHWIPKVRPLFTLSYKDTKNEYVEQIISY